MVDFANSIGWRTAAPGLNNFEMTTMMRLVARRQDPCPSSGPRGGSAPPRSADPPGRRARRRARPEGEALEPRLLMASGHHGRPAATDLDDRVEQVLQPYLAGGQFPGISVAVVIDGKVALARGYGLSDVPSGAPVRADTRFDIGSVTKTFTALGVLLLYQESRGTSHPLDLDAPIGQYLRNTRSFKLPPRWSRITTRELLDMTSGITDEGGARPWQAQLESSARIPLLYAPGTETSYSDTNYNLLGELIEQRTGERYGTFIRDRILGPLGMSGSQELGRSARVPNQAVGYGAPRHGRWPRAERQNGPAMYAAAGMASTAQDMATYITALLGGRLLDPATYGLMWTSTPTRQYGVDPPYDASRGLGWDTAIDTGAGPTEVTKSGQVPGYTSQLILYPSSNSGVFVSFNANHQGGPDPSGAVAFRVAESVYEATRTGALG
jgi:CubicO group peptidase (beta-lactamase class C family)